MLGDRDRLAIRDAFNACDQDRLNDVLVALAWSGAGDDAEREMDRCFHEATAEVRAWWLEDCNCDGHLS